MSPLDEARAVLAKIAGLPCEAPTHGGARCCLCTLPRGHSGPHEYDPEAGLVEADHLRAALAEVDRLTAELTALRTSVNERIADAYDRGVQLTDERHEAEVRRLAAEIAALGAREGGR